MTKKFIFIKDFIETSNFKKLPKRVKNYSRSFKKFKIPLSMSLGLGGHPGM